MPNHRQSNFSANYRWQRGSIVNGTDSPASPAYLNYNWVNSFDGVDNPYWKIYVKQGNDATTSAVASETKITSSPFIDALWFLDTGFNQIYYYAFGNPVEVLPSLPIAGAPGSTVSSVTNRAMAQFVDKAKSALSSFESGQDLGEIKQTIESILHPMKSLKEHVLSYFSSVKKLKSRYKKVHELKKALADTYLEWTFGWKPLTYDIGQGIADLSNKSARLPSAPIQSYAKEKFQHDVVIDEQRAQPSVGGYGNTTLVTGEFSVRLKGMVNVYYHGGPPSLAQELQVLPEDFLPTAWDLLPYSFVVDYFLNIGDIIKAISFPSAALRWACMTTHDVRTLKQSYYPLGQNYGFAQNVWSSNNLEASSKSYQRNAVYPSSLVPSLQFSLPLTSAKPWENIAALIAGRSKPLTPLW
jgi:hypothetical protein